MSDEIKTIEVAATDLQQLAQLTRVIAEGKYEIKGDTILTVAASLRWLGALADRLKNAKIQEPAPEEEVPVQSISPRRKGPK